MNELCEERGITILSQFIKLYVYKLYRKEKIANKCFFITNYKKKKILNYISIIVTYMIFCLDNDTWFCLCFFYYDSVFLI